MSEEKVKNGSAVGAMIKNALILFAFTLVAGVILGMVYDITKVQIAAQEEAATQSAYKAVFAEADSFNLIYSSSDDTLDASIGEAFDAIKSGNSSYSKVTLSTVNEALDASGNVLGYVISVSSSGYSSNIVFSVGLKEGDAGTHLNAVSIVSISESPGLGMNAESMLIPQMNNEDESGVSQGRDDLPLTVTKDSTGTFDNGKVNAITAATITTNAITNGVNAAYDLYEQQLKGGT